MSNTLKDSAQLLIEKSKIFKPTDEKDSNNTVPFDDPFLKKWFNDVYIFSNQLPDNYPLKNEIYKTYIFREKPSSFDNMVSYLESICSDKSLYTNNSDINQTTPSIKRKEYDVFISHAHKDKLEFVNELTKTINKLGIKVFYDSDELSWGDNFKKELLQSTEKSEFAIIVISKNYFGREWTERELSEFLKRQNESGQKIVLPLLYNVTIDEMKEKYPELGDIQAISSSEFSKEEITILLAKELIKRLRGIK